MNEQFIISKFNKLCKGLNYSKVSASTNIILKNFWLLNYGFEMFIPTCLY